jgi:hypothetical protein
MANVFRLDWIHPSCRDLVIEELATQPELLNNFLRSMSLQGIKLAISDSGGASGDRQLPLMSHPNTWEVLEKRCLELANLKSNNETTDLLTALTSAATNAPEPARKDSLRKVVAVVCATVVAKWNRESVVLSADHLLAYSEASILVHPFPSMPNLETSWETYLESLRSDLADAENGAYLEPEPIREWTKFITVVNNNEPRFLRAVGFPVKLTADITRLVTQIDSEVEAIVSFDSADEYDAEIERLNPIKNALDSLIKLLPLEVEDTINEEDDPLAIPPELSDLRKLLIMCSGKLSRTIDSLKEKSATLTPPEPDYDGDSYRGTEDYFDIEGLFSDL